MWEQVTEDTTPNRFIPSFSDPLSLIPGESVLVTMETELDFPQMNFQIRHGVLHLTNFRLFYVPQNMDERIDLDTLSVPYGCVGSVTKFENNSSYWSDQESFMNLQIRCRDMRFINLAFQNSLERKEIERLLEAKCFYNKFDLRIEENLFAFSYYNAVSYEGDDTGNTGIFDIHEEFMRMGAPKKYFVVSTINKDFQLIKTYPENLIMPKGIDRETIEKCANFRSKKRIPTVSWFHPTNKASLSRCSQPLTGFGIKSQSSEELDVIVVSHLNRHKPDTPFHIIDCRSRVAAFANCAKGGGSETIEKYHNASITFLDIENIHQMRNCFSKFTELSMRTDVIPKRAKFDETIWFDHITQVIDGGFFVSNLLEKGISVLVHCSDGWDRTAQIMSLAQLLSDPFYRTIKGFGILIQKDWVSFGHKFRQRLGQGNIENGDAECSPIFVQFIETVFHLMSIFEHAFEFNQKYLITILDHLYSGVFGSFIGNCDQERYTLRVNERTKSLWSWLLEPSRFYTFQNLSYEPNHGSLDLNGSRFSTALINVWMGYYHRYNYLIRQVLKNNRDSGEKSIEKLFLQLSKRPELVKAMRENNGEFECTIELDIGDESKTINIKIYENVIHIGSSTNEITLSSSLYDDYNPKTKTYSIRTDSIFPARTINVIESSESDDSDANDAIDTNVQPKGYLDTLMSYLLY